MSSIIKPLIATYLCDAPIAKCLAVKISATNGRTNVAVCSATTDLSIGITQNATTTAGDEVEVAHPGGGAKALAMESSEGKKDCMDQIAASIKLHGTDRVILMLHMDCGGYGGSRRVANQKRGDLK